MTRWTPIAAIAIVAVIGVLLTARAGGHHPASPATTTAALGTTTSVAPTTTVIPRPVSPIAGNPFPGEGVWLPAGQRTTERPPVFVTTLRPPDGGPPAGIARIDTRLTRTVVYAGTGQPGGTWAAMGAVSAGMQPRLVAAFNGGFQFGSSGGGFYSDGRVGLPLRNGAASPVIRQDGTAEVDQWGRDVTLGPDIAQVRQNLDLLVDAGKPTAASYGVGNWGATLGRSAATWRSAVGSDDHHNLYFVGGPGLTPYGLASVIAAAGAVRAMELDINPQWVFFAFYGGTPLAGYKLLPSMNYGPSRVLTPDWRDFVAVFTRPRW